MPARSLSPAPGSSAAGGDTREDRAEISSDRAAVLGELEERLGIKFRDRSLLHVALVHGSAGTERRSRHGENYERLEFLGDSVLNLAISDHLYRQFPKRLEGDLARLRASIVNEAALARVGRVLDLGRYVVLGRGEEKGGGRSRPALLADAVEAVLGAIYIDSGYGVAHYFVTRWFGDDLSRLEEPGEGDYKSQLQEMVQQLERRLPRYRITGQRGPEHDRAFVAIVEVNGRVLGEGRGRSKKEAEQAAAQQEGGRAGGGAASVGAPETGPAGMKHLWAPWRLQYIKGTPRDDCIFCALPAERRDRDNHILHRGSLAFVMLNRFPYTSGHLMVVPNRHIADLAALTDEEALEIFRLTGAAMEAIRRTYRPEGFNIGVNIGRAAGAGIVDHVHLHVVPRWVGDTNFMPVLGEVKVLPEDLGATYDRLAPALRDALRSRTSAS